MIWLEAWEFNPLPNPPYAPVLTVDPGKGTGVAELRVDGTVFGCEGDWDSTLDYVELAVAAHQAAGNRLTIVCESFTITPETARNTQAPWSLEAIGHVRRVARRHGFAPIVEQLPVEAKRFSTSPRLKTLGWWKSTKDGHVNDALRHLYLYLCERNVVVPPVGVV